ncbi:Cytochrome P450 [Galdieria sulphuraria]|uniref:Cytochrome p450 n=1 Tax=Galdieria sulphuraria TaxID=130081 RepID=M2XEE8_GALSU|nr:cytochrome p450 [Galdieria sulphuraria]EME28332.1 cytochrome p450 [Galdieria sulphuraria]GJD12518.1 Cytochrome P450 [Galdieria sulphuraria]|eukprot:XP_005704852.1 cytochrome p450 [Galdieria sulphuraria]
MLQLWIVLVTFSCLFLYVFILPKWRNRHIPGPRPSLLLGNVSELSRQGGTAPLVFERFRKQYGDVFQIWSFYRQIVVISHPDDIKYIIVTKNFPKAEEFNLSLSPLAGRGLLTVGKSQHQERRRAISKHFNEDFLRQLHRHMRVELMILLSKLQQVTERKESIDFDKEATSYTLDVMCRTGFGCTANTQEDASHPISRAVNVSLREMYHNLVAYPIRNCFGLYSSPALKNATGVIREFASQVIEARRTESEEDKTRRPLDLLDIFLKMDNLSDQNIIAEIATFLVAGHDTTSHTMSWLIYEVCQHPEIEQKIQQEVDTIWGDRQDWMLSFEEIGQLEYLNKVWKETLRKHPVAATGTLRRLDTDVTLPSCGMLLRKNTAILVPIYLVHRNPEFWPDPETFEPERFTRENTMKRHPFAFQAFSNGPRNCIGQFFATHEALTTLSSLYHFFTFRLACRAEDVKPYHAMTMKPSVGKVSEDAKGVSEYVKLPVWVTPRNTMAHLREE